MLTNTKKDAVRRMKIIQGQVKKILSMIEQEEYCPDILLQSLAAQNGLKQVEAKLLEGHLKTCVKKQMTSGKTDKAVKELLNLFQLSKKNK
jgi:DNA-binding FrmR family transcriptional regulator